MKKDLLLISHNIDLDGVGSLILSKYYNFAIDKFHLISYDDEFDEDGKPTFPTNYKNLILTDFSPYGDFYNYIIKHFDSYKIFDHHEPSLQLTDDPNCFIDMKRSGTKLFYDYITKKKRVPIKVKQMVTLIDTYDLWKKTDPLWEEAQNLNRVLWESISYNKTGWHKYESFIDRQLFKLKEEKSKEFYFDDYELMLIQQAIQKETTQFRIAEERMQKRVDEKGFSFLIYEGKSKISLVCSMLLEKYTDISYVINVNTFAKFKEEINGKLSVRARDPFNVNNFEIINGHVLAGGGSMHPQQATELLNGSINELKYAKDNTATFDDDIAF